MANESIRAAFERMWQHTVAKIEDEIAGLEDGTNVLVVIAEWDEENECYKASHTPKQIYDYVQSGGVAVLRLEEPIFYNLYYAGEEYTAFFHVEEDLTYSMWEIDDSCKCRELGLQTASWENVSTKLMQVITVDENGVPSMTSQEIYNLVHNGGRVVLKYNDRMYSLASCTEGSAYFNYYSDEYRMHCIEICNNNLYEYGTYVPASVDWVSEQIGSIETALDEILEIQQSLIDSALPQAEGVEF